MTTATEEPQGPPYANVVMGGRSHRVFGDPGDVRRLIAAEQVLVLPGPDGPVPVDVAAVEAIG